LLPISPKGPTFRPPAARYHRQRVKGFLLACVIGSAALLAACGGTPPATNADDALSRALQAHTAGKLDEATSAYFETLVKDPKNKFAFYNLGVIAHGQNRPAAAESYYRLAIEQDARMGSALFNLAILRANAGANQEAADLYRRVIAIDPNYAAAHFNLGLVLRLLGQNAEAQVELAKAQQLDAKLVAPTPSASPARQASPSPTR
jgi:tetratricopeptide (TPR) repeat protein